jgi:uncharacterized protein DUF6650
MKIKEFMTKISGIDTPFGGVSWTPPANERQVIYRLMQQMGDRRLIRHCHGGLEYAAVVRSVETMRANITVALGELEPESRSRNCLETMRFALHLFQDFVESEYPRSRFVYEGSREAPLTENVLTALYRMRSVVWKQLEILAQSHDVVIQTQLLINFGRE